MRCDLGVGLRAAENSSLVELESQLLVVFDDSVVNDGNGSVVADVGVSVFIRGPAVSCPPGVANRSRAFRQRVVIERRPQVVKAPGPFDRAHPFGSGDGDAGAVIPPVLQTGEAFENDVQRAHTRGTVTDISNYSAHGCSLTVPRALFKPGA